MECSIVAALVATRSKILKGGRTRRRKRLLLLLLLLGEEILGRQTHLLRTAHYSKSSHAHVNGHVPK